MTKPILPGHPSSVPTSPAPTSTAHVNLHATGAKKGVRGKGTQPGDVVHEESYSDKVDEQHSKKLDPRARALGAGLYQPQTSLGAPRGGAMARPGIGRRETPSQPDEGQQLKHDATHAKHALSGLLLRASAGPQGQSAQGALEGLERKLAIGSALAQGSPRIERAQMAFAQLDQKLSLSALLDGGSPHLGAAQAAFSRFDEQAAR